MEHLKNFLMGVGDVLSAFGTAPQYRYPKPGDRRLDAERIAGDWRLVGKDMEKTIEREKRERSGAINYGATQG
ncbi:hypothetical protein [Variovorax sp. JS1663]|uniref:hypothetical protein n=1 Tax=Variovorax sp. JS1663 TaxID=1851577 RepID=UPI00117E5BB2|nr:hypothetical protein [Variovorax sp. JS1663]